MNRYRFFLSFKLFHFRLWIFIRFTDQTKWMAILRTNNLKTQQRQIDRGKPRNIQITFISNTNTHTHTLSMRKNAFGKTLIRNKFVASYLCVLFGLAVVKCLVPGNFYFKCIIVISLHIIFFPFISWIILPHLLSTCFTLLADLYLIFSSVYLCVCVCALCLSHSNY